jgi:hypothetical protein
MEDFQYWTDSNNLVHLPTRGRGAFLSWANGRRGHAYTKKRGLQFKFLKMWSLHDSCKDVIKNCWNTLVVGCPMFILSQKLKMLKEKLKTWNKDIFGNVRDQIESCSR